MPSMLAKLNCALFGSSVVGNMSLPFYVITMDTNAFGILTILLSCVCGVGARHWWHGEYFFRE